MDLAFLIALLLAVSLGVAWLRSAGRCDLLLDEVRFYKALSSEHVRTRVRAALDKPKRRK